MPSGGGNPKGNASEPSPGVSVAMLVSGRVTAICSIIVVNQPLIPWQFH